MRAHGENRYRATILVIGGVQDELIIRGKRHRRADLKALIGFDEVFGRLIEAAVANGTAKTADAQEIGMVGREPIEGRTHRWTPVSSSTAV